jgi:hypothetical protein
MTSNEINPLTAISPTHLEEIPAFTETFPTPDDLIQNVTDLERVVAQPSSLVAARSTGDHIEDHNLRMQVDSLRDGIIATIYQPEALALQTERIRKRVAEEVKGGLASSASVLEETKQSQDRVTSLLNDIEGQLPGVMYRLNNIYEDIHRGGQLLEVDQFSYDVHTARSFYHDWYSPALVSIDKAYDEVKDSINNGKVRAKNAAEQAEHGQGDFYRQRSFLSEDPESAISDDTSTQIEARGSQTVADHQEACDQETSNSLEEINGMHSDALEISNQLAHFKDNLEVKRVLNESDYFGESYAATIDQLSRELENVLYGGVTPLSLSGVIETAQQQLAEMKNRLEVLRAGQESDISKTNTLASRIRTDTAKERYEF